MSINEHVKPNGWGANLDPNNWKVTNMQDDPNLFKVVDKNEVNVAHKFQTQADAEQFIEFHKSKQLECGNGKVWNYLKNQCEVTGNDGDNGIKTIYKMTGKKAEGINHVQNIHCSGHAAASRRGDFDHVGFINQEATVVVQFTTDCKCGDELTIKHWGGKHSDNDNSCFEIGCVNQSGKVGRMGEGFHPYTSSPKPTKVFANIGSVKGAKIGVKSIVWKTNDGGHHEMWIDKTATGNNWEKVAEWNFTSWGSKGSDGMWHDDHGKNTTQIPSNHTIEFRCDCDGAKFSDMSVVEIVPGVKA
ncbi:hypothetical protein [Candidatus Nitrosocosmicus sp. SS]|jgi:hypothetical protein|uniref:hypothetical protein n=1 Tax=Candidatus Nitrosocosmicus agrestis TaxID=2563600 RepID=UPI00122DFFCB|nr:hypothetical protein [Candidatus Nitrosocosmicus sp. SS]KAA2283532.1 hypothetical protein F1Z66_01220 [Candidatus Nitrosocosmicus sp. SS]KAF0869613.1 hypothetical protein E5N71_03750 [Candidatus Nitrosocosmicus sp. SS]MDR4490264.1 hypothetical protein [Candidatus Nitrosocosmicus sp.]